MRTCSVEGCDRKHAARGYCHQHWKRWRKTGEPGPAEIRRSYRGKFQSCTVEGCDRKVDSRGFCKMHYSRVKRTGEPGPVHPHLVFGNGGPHVQGYWMVTVDGQRKMQHRVVMEQHLGRELLPGETVHHVNGDRADNRLENLELWTSSHPRGQRVEDKVAWAKEIIALYGD